MKKILSKIKRKKEEKPSRITNETVAEHRERILAGGRKFKYPVQYARHKLVINTIVISITSLLIIIFLCWWQLYPAQNTSGFFYRFTQIVPVPVATIDGEQVRYSDYLMRFRSSLHFLQKQNMININSDDGKRQIEHLKRQSLDQAVTGAFVEKLARERNITIDSEQINAFITKERQAQITVLSEEAYEQSVLREFYDWSLDEYKSIVRNTLLKREVSFAIDAAAKKRVEEIRSHLERGEDFARVAKDTSDDPTKNNGGDVGFVARSSQDQNGLVQAALSLKVNQVSDIIKGTDGYYIIKLLEADEKRVRYARIKVSLTEFTQLLETKKTKNLQEYIGIAKESATLQ